MGVVVDDLMIEVEGAALAAEMELLLQMHRVLQLHASMQEERRLLDMAMAETVRAVDGFVTAWNRPHPGLN